MWRCDEEEEGGRFVVCARVRERADLVVEIGDRCAMRTYDFICINLEAWLYVNTCTCSSTQCSAAVRVALREC